MDPHVSMSQRSVTPTFAAVGRLARWHPDHPPQPVRLAIEFQRARIRLGQQRDVQRAPLHMGDRLLHPRERLARGGGQRKARV